MKWVFYILLLLVPFVIAPWEDWARLPKEVFCWGSITLMVFIILARGETVLKGRNLPLAILFVWLTWVLWDIGFGVLNNAPMIIGNDRERDVLIYEQFLNTNILNMILFAFLFCWIVGGELSEDAALRCMMVSTFVLIVWGLLQYFNVPFLTRVGHPWRVSGLFGNPNTFNEHVAVALPLFLLMRSRLKWAVIVLGVISILCAKFFIHLSPGAGLLSLPFGFGFLLLVKRPRIGVALIGVCALACVALYPVAKTAVNASFNARMEFAKITINEIQAHPERLYRGWGLGMYKQRVGKIPGGYKRDGSYTVLCEAHNEYLQFFAEGGIVGAALLAVVLLHLACVAVWNMRDKRVLVMTACLINAAVIGGMSFLMHIASTSLYVFVFYSLIYRIHYADSQARLSRP